MHDFVALAFFIIRLCPQASAVRSLQFQEYFSGAGVLTEVAGSTGFQAAPGLDIATGTDLRDADVVAREVKRACNVAWGHFAPVCTAYSTAVFWSGGKRKRSLAGKDAAWLRIAVAIMLAGGVVTIENPQRSLIWGTRKMQRLAKDYGMVPYVLHQCMSALECLERPIILLRAASGWIDRLSLESFSMTRIFRPTAHTL